MSEDMRFCPNCGSTGVKPDTTMSKSIGGIGDINSWRCKNCGYSGPMPQGDTEEDFEENAEDIEFEETEEYSRISDVKKHNLDMIMTLGFVVLIAVLLVLERLI